MTKIAVQPLGQSGFRLDLGGTIVYIDPYLTDHAAERDSADLKRQRPAPMRPEDVKDAHWALVSHGHLDHCDTQTLMPLMRGSAGCRVICPGEVAAYLKEQGFDGGRVRTAVEKWADLGGGVSVRPVPAAHPAVRRDADGNLACVGYLVRYADRSIYHSGDTSPDDAIFAALAEAGPVDTAFIPVNERNYFRARRGIIGNMSIREAFAMAEEIGARQLVPMHWDLFKPNGAFREEIELLHRLIKPPFDLLMDPKAV